MHSKQASSKSDVKEILKLSLSYPTDDEQFRTASESFVMEKVNCDSRKAQNVRIYKMLFSYLMSDIIYEQLLQNVYLLSKKLNTEGMTHDSMVSLFPEYFHEKLRNLLIKLLVVTSTSVTEKEEQRTQPEPEEHPVEQKSTASISMRHEHNIRQEKVEKVQQEGKIPDMIISKRYAISKITPIELYTCDNNTGDDCCHTRNDIWRCIVNPRDAC